jgi:hypothetical protein
MLRKTQKSIYEYTKTEGKCDDYAEHTQNENKTKKNSAVKTWKLFRSCFSARRAIFEGISRCWMGFGCLWAIKTCRLSAFTRVVRCVMRRVNLREYIFSRRWMTHPRSLQLLSLQLNEFFFSFDHTSHLTEPFRYTISIFLRSILAHLRI